MNPKPKGPPNPTSPISPTPHTPTAFTLVETLIALAIFALIASAIYTVSSASIEATTTTTQNLASEERLLTFLRATRNALLNLPARASVQLRFDNSAGVGTPELVFRGAASPYGVASLAGGDLILAARPQADGTRTLSLLRIPRNTSTTELNLHRQKALWLPLLPRLDKVEWAFFQDGEWLPLWETDQRPKLIRLRFHRRDEADVIESTFFIPPAEEAAEISTPDESPNPNPSPSPN